MGFPETGETSIGRRQGARAVGDYRVAFSEMLSHTSTEWAPWYVIPADREWFGRIGAGVVKCTR